MAANRTNPAWSWIVPFAGLLQGVVHLAIFAAFLFFAVVP